MDECKIVADLLPTYCDDLTGEETNAFIRNHLSSCPSCSGLLEKMQQKRDEQKEAEFRRADFRAAMALYERKHRIRVALLVWACLLLIGVFFVLRACSFDLALAASGLNRKQAEVVQQPATRADGEVFQIVFSRTESGDGALVWLERNVLGFWTVSSVETATSDQPYGVARFTWGEPVFSFYGSTPYTTFVWYEIYAGCNAASSFEQFPWEQIPGNVTVLVNQRYQSYYILHVTTVLPNGGQPFEILPLLKESNLIA